MPISKVHLRGTSTETVPNTSISGASLVADLNGLAIKVNTTVVASKAVTPPGWVTWVGLRRCWELIQFLSPSQTLLLKNLPSPSLSLCWWYSTQPLSWGEKPPPFLLHFWRLTGYQALSVLLKNVGVFYFHVLVILLLWFRPVPLARATARLCLSTRCIACHSGFMPSEWGSPQNKSGHAVNSGSWFADSYPVKSWPLSVAPILNGLSWRPAHTSPHPHETCQISSYGVGLFLLPVPWVS